MNNVEIRMPGGELKTVPYGTAVRDLTETLDSPKNPGQTIVAALVDNEFVSLSYKFKVGVSFKPVTLDSALGMSAYKSSLCFLLTIAAREAFPGKKLVIGHSLADGYYYSFTDLEHISDADIAMLETRMRSLIDKNLTIERTVISYNAAREYFEAHGQAETAALLEFRNQNKIAIIRCGEFMDLSHGPLVPATGLLGSFQIYRYGAGFVLRFPEKPGQKEFPPFQGSPVLYGIYHEYKNWGKVLGVSSLGQLNRISAGPNIKDFIYVAEALHNKKIAHIADMVYERGKSVKVVLIAGPSSSGKTTFTKKLAIELTVHGYVPVMLSLDDYFVERDKTPRDAQGNYDFEALEAIDVELLNQHLLALFQGDEVEIPTFDFKSGSRKQNGKKLKLPSNGILLMEGIHGLNDRLTPRIPAASKFLVYVSALTQLNLDEHTRVSTTVNRLIRRMVRDHQFRGHSAHKTLAMWPSVRRGEDKNIFPFQDSADACFNSALDYELGVLKFFAEPILRTVKPGEEYYYEALRLLSFLEYFIPIPVKYVPPNSILREFVGDSGFKY